MTTTRLLLTITVEGHTLGGWATCELLDEAQGLWMWTLDEAMGHVPSWVSLSGVRAPGEARASLGRVRPQEMCVMAYGRRRRALHARGTMRL